MEYDNNYRNDDYINIENFSRKIGEKIGIGTSIVKDYILAKVSIGLASDSDARVKIDEIYNKDNDKYYGASINSSTVNYILMNQGDLEEEIYARKVLGILLIAEYDFNLRNSIIKILRIYYPEVFNSVKKVDKKKLVNKYSKMDKITREIEAKLDSAVYFYITIYKSPNWLDEGFITAIIDDIMDFEFEDFISVDIQEEIKEKSSKIYKIKEEFQEKYGEIIDYKDFIAFINKYDEEKLSILKNIFKVNKLDIDYLFKNDEFNIDKIILAYIEAEKVAFKLEDALINSAIMQLLIDKYKESKEIYFNNNEETVNFKLKDLKSVVNEVTDKNRNLNLAVKDLEEYKNQTENILHNERNKLIKEHNIEINYLKNRIKELENNLYEEQKYKMELNALREYVFEKDNNYIPEEEEKSLVNYINGKKIIIIGGAKEWRRKFREKYPEIRSLNGFNENFDVTVLGMVDYVFFFTGHMSHATYYKAINYIRLNQIPFGYIGKTNLDLVELELIDGLEKYKA
ncbi:hypothetical protein [Clostridium intestinale]|uniref:DUF2325 domain-containing protein n=1 Tax=Clostridium intestinale TaxID=36845 RepID=A0A7D6ZZB9_9CLOT|nr:hypothetical protein [Clostridium intestinale]QLY81042.1 hypothetical protein HZF06_05490 [Clostridium intestinale]